MKLLKMKAIKLVIFRRFNKEE